MLQELFTIKNGVPEWAHSLGWAIVLVVFLLIRAFWKNYGSKAFSQWTNSVLEKDRADKKLLYTIRDDLIHENHHAMQQILDKCTRKGYCNSADIEAISKIYDYYKDVGGNTDGERIMAKFDMLPYKTELKVPEYPGIENPSEEAVKQMIEFYNYIKKKIIHETDIKPIKTVTEYVNKEMDKNNKEKKNGTNN